MIEVEKKFILNEGDQNRLIDGALFLHERVFTDVYYDTKDFALTSEDKWLRAREGRFELKLPMESRGDRLMDQYDEIENEGDIRKALGFEADKSLVDILASQGYQPFCTCKTTRRKYKKAQFIIDLDTVDFQEFVYHIGEIELMVSEKGEIDGAIDEILVFAQQNGLEIAPVRGKVIEYLKRIKPDHYRALIKAGILKDAT